MTAIVFELDPGMQVGDHLSKAAQGKRAPAKGDVAVEDRDHVRPVGRNRLFPVKGNVVEKALESPPRVEHQLATTPGFALQLDHGAHIVPYCMDGRGADFLEGDVEAGLGG